MCTLSPSRSYERRMQSFIAELNGYRLHSDAAVSRIDGGLWRTTALTAVAIERLTAEHSTERDAELFTEPAVDDEVDGRLDGQQQHGQQSERQQRNARLVQATNAHDRRIDHIRSLDVNTINARRYQIKSITLICLTQSIKRKLNANKVSL